MDTQTMDVGELIALYLADQLNKVDTEMFEDLLLNDDDVLWELEVTARFKVGLMDLFPNALSA